MEMATLCNHLINMGGVGILAGVLFYLHLNAIKAFREELKEERAQCHADHEKIMDSIRHLTEAVARLVGLMGK